MTSTGEIVLLTNVLLVPKQAASLISLAKLLKAGMHIEVKGNIVLIHDCSISFLNFVLKEDLFQMTLSITDTSEQALDFSYTVEEKKGRSNPHFAQEIRTHEPQLYETPGATPAGSWYATLQSL